ncbi:MAG: hypothetical protein EBT03_11370 [Betaproteobacteria bacterium]|nr:hypothetical protein [Betaproteobacteria bacterium]
MADIKDKPEMRDMTFAVVWSDNVLRSSMQSMTDRLGELMEYRGVAWQLHSTNCTPEDEAAKTWMVHFGFREVPDGDADVGSLEPDSLIKFARENYLTLVDLGHKFSRYAVL